LGDPWTYRWFGVFGFRLGLLFLCLADHPSVAGGPSGGEVRPGVLRVSRVFLSVFVSIRLASYFWSVGVWRTVRLDVADRPRGTSCSRTV
jgi:hypothetical protein